MLLLASGFANNAAEGLQGLFSIVQLNLGKPTASGIIGKNDIAISMIGVTEFATAAYRKCAVL
jgi:hypothetical protein